MNTSEDRDRDCACTSRTLQASICLGRRSALLAVTGSLLSAYCGFGRASGDSAPRQVGLRGAKPAPERLTLDGARLLDANGQPMHLRGINEGTWGEMIRGDAGVIAGQGANVVRLLIRWWGLYGTDDIDSRLDNAPGHFRPENLDRFLDEVQWCVAAGLWVIPVIDSNCGQSGVQSPDMTAYCDPAGAYPDGHNFWTDPVKRRHFKDAWVHLAGILKDCPRIAFYELLPEPLSGADASVRAELSEFYQELMAAIEDRAGDRRTPLLIGARDAYNIRLCDEAYCASPRWKNRVVYTGNLFVHPSGSRAESIATLDERLASLVHMQQRRNVPVFVQQFGVRSGDDPHQFYLDAGLRRMTAAGVGYTGWQWRQNTSDMDEYALIVRERGTNRDIVKRAELSVYSHYWRAQ